MLTVVPSDAASTPRGRGDPPAKDAESKMGAPLTVAAAVDAYLADLAVRGRAVAETARVLRCHVLPVFAQRTVESLTRSELRRWHRLLASQAPLQGHRRGTQLRSRATANRILTCFKAALNFAWHEGEVSSDAAWRPVKPFRDAETPRRDLLTPELARRLVAACEADFAPLVRTALATGCRWSELTGLEVADFDALAGSLCIRAGKSARLRHVALTVV